MLQKPSRSEISVAKDAFSHTNPLISVFSSVTIKAEFLFLSMANRDRGFVCTFAMETSISSVHYFLCTETALVYAGLFCQQFRFKSNLIRSDTPDIEGVQCIAAVEEAEQLVC